MTSKAERKRRTRAKRAKVISLAGGEAVEQKPTGRDRVNVGQRKPQEDPMRTVIEARRRFMGDMADKVDLRSAMAGDDLGRAILKWESSAKDARQRPASVSGTADTENKQEAISGPSSEASGANALWGAVTHMRRTVAAYDRACGAPSRHPKCLSILTPPDRMEATAESPAWDDRPQEDRDRAAVAAYMALQGWLAHCDASARSACLRAVVDDAGVSDLPGIILALLCVVDGRAGRKIVWRGRTGR